MVDCIMVVLLACLHVRKVPSFFVTDTDCNRHLHVRVLRDEAVTQMCRLYLFDLFFNCFEWLIAATAMEFFSAGH